MTWANFYLLCFALGFAFSLLSFLTGGLHWHLPHFLGAAHGHSAAHGHAGHAGAFLNPVTLAAFLAWFGGIGYLLTRYSALGLLLGLGVSVLGGLAGAGAIYLFLRHVLMSQEENLDPEDYVMIGVLGQTSMPIRQGGTGEIIYSQAGTRHTCGARTEDGSAIARGIEIVVTRYERGIAYVRTWEQMAGEPAAGESQPAPHPSHREERSNS
jgi:hypothetical protein